MSLAPVDCSDIKSTNLTSVDGLYTIILSGGVRLEVFCDMSTDGGGWLVSTYFFYSVDIRTTDV